MNAYVWIGLIVSVVSVVAISVYVFLSREEDNENLTLVQALDFETVAAKEAAQAAKESTQAARARNAAVREREEAERRLASALDPVAQEQVAQEQEEADRVQEALGVLVNKFGG